ncbi:MAG: PQQ-binding-like beta-propeller repeat protein, partial [Candidatus Glassbacteria bacterium]
MNTRKENVKEMRLLTSVVSILLLSPFTLYTVRNSLSLEAGGGEALDPHQSRWEVVIGKGLTARPEALGERVFALSSDGWAALVDCERGEILWRERAGYAFNSPATIIDNVAYAVSQGAKRFLTAVSLDSGKSLWKHKTGYLKSGPIRVGKGLAILESDGVLKRFDLQGPTLRWWASLGKPCLNKLFKIGENLLVCCADTIFSISADNGEIKERYYSGSLVSFHPLGQGDGILVVRRRGEVALMDADREESIWSINLAPSPVYHVTASGGVLLITAGSDLTCLVPENGEVVWKDRLPSPAAGPPSIRDDLLAITTVHGGLFIYEKASGKIIKKQELGQPVSSPPVMCTSR